jgi:TolB-like protein
MHLFKELQRRNVFRVTLGYIMSCWLLLQVADLVLENIGAPDWVIQTIMLLLALGFPVVVFFSWAYEVTPEGIRRDSEVDHSRSIAPVTGRKLDRAILVLLFLSLGYFVWESRFSDRTDTQSGVPAVEQAKTEAEPAVEVDRIDARSIAVLPFDNRSKLEDDVFFTEGVHDELLSNLAQIGSLKVISRTSVMRYQDTRLSIPEIGSQLGVATVLEGAVQRSGDTVRINVQLIDARTDEHLWAQTYDRELTAENLFTIQTEISQSIARSLRTELSTEEKERIASQRTTNLAAYDAYLRGRQKEREGGIENMRAALTLYREATGIDPAFAAAWAGRALMVLGLRETGFWGEIPEQEAFVLAQTNIDRALAIDPHSAEAHTVQARMYYEKYRFEDALNSLDLALSSNPNLAIAYREKAQILTSLGQIEAAWEAIMMALGRDPFDRQAGGAAFGLASIYLGYDQLEQLASKFNDEPALLDALRLELRMRSEPDVVEIYRILPPDGFGNIFRVKFFSLREVSGSSIDGALNPLEIKMDLFTSADQLDRALSAYYDLTEERKQVTINLERLSIIQMAQGRCEDGLASLERAHGGVIRIHGQIPPSQTRSNPNLALNWVHCMHRLGREEEAAAVLASLRGYIQTLQREAERGYGPLLVKLHIIDGEIERALDVYDREMDRRQVSWMDRADPVIRSLAGNPVFEEINARVDARINADRMKLGWPPTEGIALDSYEGQETANHNL